MSGRRHQTSTAIGEGPVPQVRARYCTGGGTYQKSETRPPITRVARPPDSRFDSTGSDRPVSRLKLGTRHRAVPGGRPTSTQKACPLVVLLSILPLVPCHKGWLANHHLLLVSAVMTDGSCHSIGADSRRSFGLSTSPCPPSSLWPRLLSAGR